MAVRSHGGGCCGVTHIYVFPTLPSTEWLKTQINNTQAADVKRPRSHLIEAVLTDQQMQMWARTLKEFGFVLGPRWFNSNSRNYCNVLTYQTRKPSRRPSFTW